jgi:predicted NUDIX family NTP pyrophosphohydrolase
MVNPLVYLAAMKSAGILAYRIKEDLEIFLVHPGGPFFKNKDLGWWSIPKGEFGEEEDRLQAAKREFLEETGHAVKGDFIELQPVKQKSGKTVYAWAIATDIDARNIRSNTFLLQWPPKSGRMQEFPEIDRAEWFTVEEAKRKINRAQVGLIDELVRKIAPETTS